MSKDAFYFPHDSNAKDDPKCVLLIEQLGLEGYGIYWALIETLRDQPNYTYPLILMSAFARKYNTTTEKVKAVINGYQLFTVTEKDFYSESLLKRMEVIDHKREMAVLAGKASAQQRLLNSGSTDVQQSSNKRSTRVQPKKEKEIKGKESKVYKSKDIYGELQNVFLTPEEYQNILDRFDGKSDQMINNLSTYIGSHGDKYKSHYATILNWANKEESETQSQKTDKWEGE